MSKLKQALAPDETISHKRKIDLTLLGRLWAYVRPHKRLMLVTLVISMITGALKVYQPLLTKRIIDDEIAAGDLRGLMQLSLLLLALILAVACLEVVFNYMANWIGQRSMHSLRKQLFRRIMSQDTVFFDRNPVGRLITRMTSDINTLNDLLSTGIVSVIGELLVLIGVFAVMIWTSPRLTGIVLLVMPLLVGVAVFFRRHSRKWYLETRRALATVNTYLQENIAGMRTVQSFNREKLNHRQFQGLNAEYRTATINTIFAFALFLPAMTLLSSLAVAGVIWIGGREVIQARVLGETTLTFGKLFMFVQYVHMLFNPIRTLSERYNLLQSAMASSERIFKLLDREPKIVAPPDPLPVPILNDAIRFEEVSFAYVENEPVLRGVSFEMRKGQSVAVVGATGAGKTTLINLLTRFYDVNEGRISFDAIDIRRFDPKQLRRQFAVVLQEVFLFSGTIADNLRLANHSLSDDQLWSILEQVGADEFVAALPNALNASVSERGETFSTGQKQLLAFARALAADPQILILDEATANIDTETEQQIQAAISTLLQGRTSLIIAHRLSTIQRADQILVMHHGRVHETGTHDELLRQDGIYRRLYELQYRKEAVAG